MITVKIGEPFEVSEIREVTSVWVFATLWPIATIRERIAYRITKAIAKFRETQAMNRAEARAAIESINAIERIKEEAKP